MSNEIQEAILRAVQRGQLIKAIKLLREVENLSLSEAREKVEAMSRVISSRERIDEKRATQIHSHPPARSGVYDVEKDLSTEAFLYLQKGEVSEGLKIIQESKGIGKSAASNLAKTFYKQHPEYHSSEIEKLMQSRHGLSSAIEQNNSPKRKKMKFIEIIVIGFFIFIFLSEILN